MKGETENFGFTRDDFENYRKSQQALQNSRVLPEGVSIFDALLKTEDDENMKLIYETLAKNER